MRTPTIMLASMALAAGISIGSAQTASAASVPGCFGSPYITYNGQYQYVRLVNNCNITNTIKIQVSYATDRCATFQPYQGLTFSYGYPIRYQGITYC